MGSRVSARLILISLLTLAFTFNRILIAIMPTYSADARMKFLREDLSEVGSQVLWVGSCIRTFGTQLTRSECLRADASRAWQAECRCPLVEFSPRLHDVATLFPPENWFQNSEQRMRPQMNNSEMFYAGSSISGCASTPRVQYERPETRKDQSTTEVDLPRHPLL